MAKINLVEPPNKLSRFVIAHENLAFYECFGRKIYAAPFRLLAGFGEMDGINLARSKSVTSLQTSIQPDLTDRVRARLKDPHYTISHANSYENQFGYTSELFAPKWSRSARVAVGIIGMASLLSSIRSRGAMRKGLGVFGLASLIRAISNLHVTDLIGWLANPSVRLKRKIRVNAPVDDVYDFLSHFSNYPRFMSYIKNVEVNDLGGLRWTMIGPAGVPIHWNTSLGKMIDNQAISWKSSINSVIRNSGDIQLVDLPGEGAEIRVELTYAPPVGALGYAAVHFLGFDPKEKIDEDLQVLKALIEKEYSTNPELSDFRRA